jgi:hypothetical protein
VSLATSTVRWWSAGQIRDAAYTIARGVSIDQARALAGHRLPGQADHYVRRRPQFVESACRAVRAAFYP